MERCSPSGIDVLVVGAGIGGLFAGIELWRKGHDVRVIEAKDKMESIGDFVGIGVTGTRQFAKWPTMAERYDEICYKPSMSIYTHQGELLGGPWPAGKVDAIPTPVSRPKLIHLLYEFAISLGISVKFGQRVVEYFEDCSNATAGVVTTSGNRHVAELVVAADGVGSKSSKVILGTNSRPKTSGFAVYRTAFPTYIAHQDEEVAKHYPVSEDGTDDVRLYLGPSTHAITLVSKDTTTWLLTHKNNGDAAESWSMNVNADEVLRELANDSSWDQNLLALIKQTPKQKIVDWKLMLRDANPNWTSPGMLIVQLGDAAHSFLPTSANGATQAMEDGISLASCLHLAGKADITLATSVHNHLRFQRVSCCQRAGFKNRELWHHIDLEEAREHPEKLADMTGRWITNHDPEKYAYENWTKCVDHLQKGVEFLNTNLPPGYTYKPWTLDEFMDAVDAGEAIDDKGDWN